MKKQNEIGKYKENNELNLEKIVDEYSGYIYKVIENISFSRLTNEDIEEIISDTFFILWKNKDKLKNEKFMSSYLAGIAKNLVKEKCRKITFEKDISDYSSTIYDINQIDMIYEERDKVSIIEKELRKMKDDDTMIFNLYYYSGRKIKEIASILNCSEFNIKTRLYRIRKKIKKELEKEGYSFEG